MKADGRIRESFNVHMSSFSEWNSPSDSKESDDVLDENVGISCPKTRHLGGVP